MAMGCSIGAITSIPHIHHWSQWIAIGTVFCRHWRQWREPQIVMTLMPKYEIQFSFLQKVKLSIQLILIANVINLKLNIIEFTT